MLTIAAASMTLKGEPWRVESEASQTVRGSFGVMLLSTSGKINCPPAELRKMVSIQVPDRAESVDPPLRAHRRLEPMAWPMPRCERNCEKR
jgi:hypothetical protein